MILSAYEKKDSPYIWVQFAARKGAPKKYRSTGIRKNDPRRKILLDHELHKIKGELLAERMFNSNEIDDSGWGWVSDYLLTRYRAKASTYDVYRAQWKELSKYLFEKRVSGPAALVRQDVFDYVPWRIAQIKPKSGKNVQLNTALGELKLLGLIMDEAIPRGMVTSNCARKLKIERDEVAEKPEITEQEEIIIRDALKNREDWMRKSFHIGISTGLRFAETRILAPQIKWPDDQILIEKPKGGRSKGFSIPIYDSIRLELEAMRASRRPALFTIPKEVEKITSLIWRRFFDEIGMPHLCFHCTRVTFITRGMRAGIPESVMMKMVNHGSTLISRIYQRWTHADVRHYAELLAVNQNGTGAIDQNRRPIHARVKSGIGRASKVRA